HRLTFTSVYDTPWFKDSHNFLAKNALGGWQLSGTYTVESGEWATPQSGVDSNENGDTAADRAIINTGGVAGTSSAVTGIDKNGSPIVASGAAATTCTVGGAKVTGAGCTVAYVANNPNAQFIMAGLGAYANSGRNILQTPRINNIDFTIAK